MNGKTARKLRQLIATEMDFLPVVNYKEINQHVRLFPTGSLDEQGNMKQLPLTLSTRVLDACQRNLYQRAKRLHVQYHQGWQSNIALEGSTSLSQGF